MPSGMLDRYQGKIGVNTMYLGSLTNTKGGIFIRYSGQQLRPVDLNGLSGRGVLSTDPGENLSFVNYGMTAISSSSGTRSIASAPSVGLQKQIYFDLTGSTLLRKIYSGSSLITFDGTNTVFISSAAGVLNLLGLSTTRWLITGNTGAGTLGTTT